MKLIAALKLATLTSEHLVSLSAVEIPRQQLKHKVKKTKLGSFAFTLKDTTTAVTGPPPRNYEFKSRVIAAPVHTLCSPKSGASSSIQLRMDSVRASLGTGKAMRLTRAIRRTESIFVFSCHLYAEAQRIRVWAICTRLQVHFCCKSKW